MILIELSGHRLQILVQVLLGNGLREHEILRQGRSASATGHHRAEAGSARLRQNLLKGIATLLTTVVGEER